MKNRKMIAFITSLTMLMGCHSVLVSAEEITDIQPGIAQNDEQLLREDPGYEVNYKRKAPKAPEVLGQIDGMEYYDIIEINGRTYYDMDSVYYAGDELITVSGTNAVARPGTKTYVDISFDGPADLNAFVFHLSYDKDALQLVSASIKEEFYEDPDEDYPCGYFDSFAFNPVDDILYYFRNDLKPIDLSSENTIRLCFEVSADAEEKNYEISIEKADKGGLTGLQRIEYYNDYYYAISYVPGSFSSGSVKVSKTEQPKTNLMPKPLSRVYADLGVDTSVITGDVNEDGKINIADMITIKSEVLSGEEYSSNSDITEDGSVNAADILELKKYLLS